MKIDGNGEHCLKNYEWVIGVFNAKGNLVRIYTWSNRRHAKNLADKNDGYFIKDIFASLGDPF